MGVRASLACRGRELHPLPRRRSAQEEPETMIQVRGMSSPVPARKGRRGVWRHCRTRGHPRRARPVAAEGRVAGTRLRPVPRVPPCFAPLGLAAGRRLQLRSAPPGAACGVRGSGGARLSPRR